MTRPGQEASRELSKAIEEREGIRIRIGQTLYEALYNRIYDPENELTDAEEKELEPIVERVEQNGLRHVPSETARLYRKYKRFEINKFRLRWCAGGINWVDVIQKERYVPPRESDKIKAYHKGYLAGVIEQAKFKRLFDPLDMMVADSVMERALDSLFPSLRTLDGAQRRQELERLTGSSADPAIDTFIDQPETQKKYSGFVRPEAVFFDKSKLQALLETIRIIKNGFYLPPILTEKVMKLARIVQSEARKKRELDIIDASIARVLVGRVQDELERLMIYNRAQADEKGEPISEKRTASLQLHMLESLQQRITSILVSI
ncbi:hypothetical protein HYV71_04290 [Candidatus Uhrbacteria bacterium]|nr:hypothetical protein [Candidatus Uhrbacteria bacterium]